MTCLVWHAPFWNMASINMKVVLYMHVAGDASMLNTHVRAVVAHASVLTVVDVVARTEA